MDSRKKIVEPEDVANWEDYQAALALTLSSLPDGGYLVLENPAGEGAQFSVMHGELQFDLLRGPATTAPDRDLSIEADRLSEYGWAPPSDYYPNWFITAGWPAPFKIYEIVSEKVVTALRDVLRIPGPRALDAKAWVHGSPAVPDTTALDAWATHRETELSSQEPVGKSNTASRIAEIAGRTAESRAYLDGALATVHAIEQFQWTWTIGDIERFCTIMGWRISEQLGGVTILETNLPVNDRYASASVRKGVLNRVAISLADVVSEPVGGDRARELFADISGPLVSLLGRPDRNIGSADLEVGWQLPDKFLRLYINAQSVYLSVVNPAYQEELDDACD